MNRERLLTLINAVVAEQRPITLQCSEGPGCKTSLHEIAQALAAEEAAANMDPVVPAVATWLAATYEDVMALFFMQPVNQPQCTRHDLRRASEGKMKVFDALPDELRSKIIVDVLILAHCTGRPDWHRALAAHNIEASA